MTNDERFQILDDLYLRIENARLEGEAISSSERSFLRVWEASGGIDGDGVIPLWTGYNRNETAEFIKGFAEVGFTGIAERLQEIDRWITSVDGMDRADPQFTPEQEAIVEAFNQDFWRTKNRLKIIFDYADESGLVNTQRLTNRSSGQEPADEFLWTERPKL